MSTAFRLNKRGLYCVTNSVYNSGAIITTNGVTVSSYSAAPTGGQYPMQEKIIYSDGTNTVQVGASQDYRYGGSKTVIYIGPFTNISNPTFIHLQSVNNHSITVTTQNTFVHFVLSGSVRYNRDFTTENVESGYISIEDPGSANTYSAACINRGGKVTCTGGCADNSGTVGQYFIATYTLVE